MSNIAKILGFVAFSFLVVGSFWVVFKVDGPIEKSRARTVPVRREVAEDIRISRYGVYGIDLIKCGKVRLEKVRRGPFALGGFNILMIDDLKVVLPPSRNGSASGGKKTQEGDSRSSLNVLRDIGVGEDFFKANGIMKRFSGLRINGLELGRLDDMTNVIRVLTARRAVSKRSGVELSGVSLGEGGNERKIPKAMLRKSDGRILMSWSDGELFL